jgi:septum formation protein
MNRNYQIVPLLGQSVKVWLASNSDRRKVMLDLLFPDLHQSGVPGVDETPPIGSVDHQVLTICKRKAEGISDFTGAQVTIVSDTMISDPDDHSLSMGKPGDAAEAAVMLHRLSGRRHQVWSATGIHFMGKWTFFCEFALVEFPNFGDEVLMDLIRSNSWKGKAGGYDLHGAMGEHARLVDGSESVVLGIAQSAMDMLEQLSNIG